MWFKNPGQAVLASDPDYEWERYTIDNWYSSSNPVGKGFMIFPADITNDANDELIVSSHNHQEYKDGERIWPPGVFYLSIPDSPYDSVNWNPVAIDVGDAYLVDRSGGPYTQGSPGFSAVGDITGNGLNDLVVAGDGRGATYYYEAVAADAGCSLKFNRTALWDDPASMPAEVKLYDIDGDGELEILATVYDTSFNKVDGVDPDYSGSGSVFIWKLIPEAECVENSDCSAGEVCLDGTCELDAPPTLDAGPWLAAGGWPVLPTNSGRPVIAEQNFSVLWTFDDDYATCAGACTHTAEYKAEGDTVWSALTVSMDPWVNSYPYVTLPIMSLQNATTYALRLTVKDCADQATSELYYFKAVHDIDGDGYDVDEDCDDTNPEIYQLLEGYIDEGDVDLDGYSFGIVEQVCSGESLPEDYTEGDIDNCQVVPNGPLGGTCYNFYNQEVGGSCTTNADCQDSSEWYKWCDTFQGDQDNDGIGDVCEE